MYNISAANSSSPRLGRKQFTMALGDPTGVAAAGLRDHMRHKSTPDVEAATSTLIELIKRLHQLSSGENRCCTVRLGKKV